MDAAKCFRSIGLLTLNFLFSFTVSNYLSPEIDLVRSPIFSLKVFCSAYCLGYIVLNVITSTRVYSNVNVGSTSSAQQIKALSNVILLLIYNLLYLIIGLAASLSLFLCSGRYIIFSIFKWFIGILVFHCLAVLYGAALSSYVEETFMWSVLMSNLVVLPCVLVDTDDILRLIAGKQKGGFSLAYCLCIVMVLTITGAWFGAFTLPLDWDRDWQVWPIPCAAGAMVGHLLSLFTSGLLIYYEHSKKDKNKLI